MSSSELEMKRLKAAQENAERHNKAKSATLNDLFAKYNIWGKKTEIVSDLNEI